MAVTITSIERTPGGSGYIVRWTTSTPGTTCRVYRDGRLVGSTAAGWWMFSVTAGGGAPFIEILDDPAATPGVVYPTGMTLAAYSPAGAEYLQIEEWVPLPAPGAWLLRARLTAEHYVKWASRILEDGVDHVFRITPIGENGNAGTAWTVTAVMVRRPDPPAAASGAAFSYTPGTLTVAVQ